MKKSLFLSTLIAATALAVPAFADGDGTSGSPYSGTINDLDLSGTYDDNTAYIDGVTGGFVSGENKTFTTNVNIGDSGLTITSGSGDYTYTFSGAITGSGNWTCNATLSQNYIFTGDLSGYSGDIYFSDGVFGDANPSVSTITFGNGSETAVEGSVSGTGGLIFHGTVTYNYGKGEAAVVIGNSYEGESYDIKVKDLVIGGTADYVIDSNIDGYFNSTVNRNTMTITTTGTVTFNCSSITQMGMFTASNASTTLVFTEDCTLGIAYGDTNCGMDVAGTIQVADAKTLTINKAGTAYANVGTLELGTNSNLTLSKSSGSTSLEAHGLYIGTLKIAKGSSSTIKITSDSNYISIGTLVGTNVALTLTSDAGTTHANVFELGSSTTTTTSQFTGTITVSDTNTGSGRGVSLAISDEKIAAGAVIVLGEEDNSNTSLSLGVNASRVEIAGLSTTSAMGADVLYAGKIAVDNDAGNAGANITSNSETTNTLVINTANATYTFTGKVLDKLNLEKSGEGTQAFVFASGSSFDGSIAVKAGTLALSGADISSTGITVESGAILTIDNEITLKATSDVTEVSSKISGTVTITGTLNVGGTTMTLDTTLGTTQAGTVAFSDGAQLILSNEFLASASTTDDAITIIMASSITYNSQDISSDVSGFASAVISYDKDKFELSNWDYTGGVLSASVTYLPEPSMFGLFLGLGAIGLVATRRRRRA